jgi:hypothetical protein
MNFPPKPNHTAAPFRVASSPMIDHDSQRYLLRVTRENKLILTKLMSFVLDRPL